MELRKVLFQGKNASSILCRISFMTLLISRIIWTIIIIFMVYFALQKVWTKSVDVIALLKKPSEGIPEKTKEPYHIPQTSGILLPGSKPLPETKIQIPEGATVLFLGNSLAYTTSFPHTVIEVGGDQILKIDKNKGGIEIFAKFFSEDGRIVAELKGNKFFVNPNNYFRIDRPDENTLKVYDQGAKQILSVEFLTPFAIKLLGRFYFSSRPPILIEEEQLSFGGLTMSKSSFGESKVDIKIN